MSDLDSRLRDFLASRNRASQIVSLTADASTREYFRIDWDGGTAIACVYPDAFDPASQSYLDATKLFVAAGLPVAQILDVDGDLGVIVQEDLGNRVLRDVMLASEETPRFRLLDEAISLVARVQAATEQAFEMNSIASRLKFDTEKLEWELNFFKTHFFETYLKRPLSESDNARLSKEFHDLAVELESFATVLCHRDFHAANIMLDSRDRMRIIDHQDARIGSPTYDLVSLLLDRITDLPSREWLAEKRRFFLDMRVKLGLPRLDDEEFAYEFRLQTIQRCLKAAGTFSYQSAVRGKTHFIPFIKPMFRIVHRSAGNVDGFHTLKKVLENEIE